MGYQEGVGGFLFPFSFSFYPPAKPQGASTIFTVTGP